MSEPILTGVAHVALTVSDMEHTAAFWCDNFGFVRTRRVDEPVGGPRHPRILIRHHGINLALAIQQPHTHRGERFDPTRTGLDHLSFSVGTYASLMGWAALLDERDIQHSPVREVEPAHFITFEDPDGIQIELWSAKH